jgi:hypothetical protein
VCALQLIPLIRQRVTLRGRSGAPAPFDQGQGCVIGARNSLDGEVDEALLDQKLVG